jgi:hypothetical protein
MTRLPGTYTVLNGDIEPKTMSRLLSLHDLERGVVVCHPVPPGARACHLARDVLYALGKHPRALGWPCNRRAADRDCTTWLHAENITDLLLLRADLFSPASLADLAELVGGAGARTWLLFDSARHRRSATERLGARPASRVRTKARREPPCEQSVTRAKRWPTPSPWVARAAAMHIFTIDELNSIDARIHTAFKSTSAWLSEQQELQPRNIEQFLGVLTSDPVAHHRHARTVGASSALLLHGLAAEIRSRYPRPNAILCEPTPAQAHEIRRHSNPAGAAARALALLTDLDAQTLTRLTLDQLDEAPGGMRLGSYLLQGAGAAALRAHAAGQAARAQAPTTQLFTERQLADHRGTADCTAPLQLQVKLRALPDSLDVTHHQPRVGAGFTAPASNVRHEASLILRLLRLNASREIPLARLEKVEREAAKRLASARAAKLYEGTVAATEHLRFSQFIGNTPAYVARIQSERL